MSRDLGILDLEDDKVLDSINIVELKSFLNRKTNSDASSIIELKTKKFHLESVNVLIGGNYKTYFGIKEESMSGMHDFTNFFYDNFGDDRARISLADKAPNTLKNYAKPIIKFLNYIFTQGFKRIEDLDKDLIIEFLNTYAYNLLPDDNKSDRCRSKTEVNRANASITKFVYWLYTAKSSTRSKKLKYEMKYIDSSDFKFTQYSRMLKHGGVKYKYTIENIVTVSLDNSNNSKQRMKATKASLYLVKKLVEISRIMDPMITFAIVLDAFAGLRMGEVMQMHNDRFKLIDSRFQSCSLYINLLEDKRLRSDAVKTGEIKINRLQPVFEIFADIIRDEYKEHQKLLIQKGFFMHKYGAVFINDEGKAMTSDNYMRRFKRVADQSIINIKIEASKEDELAIREERLLECQTVTPHSLRYIYSQFIKDAVGEKAAVAYYRGDSSLKSQDTYVPETNLKRAKELFFNKYINV